MHYYHDFIVDFLKALPEKIDDIIGEINRMSYNLGTETAKDFSAIRFEKAGRFLNDIADVVDCLRSARGKAQEMIDADNKVGDRDA